MTPMAAEKHYGLTSLGHLLSTLKSSLVRSVYTKSEHSWLSKSSLRFAEPQFRPAVIEAVAGNVRAHGNLDPPESELSWVKRVIPQFLSQMANQYLAA